MSKALSPSAIQNTAEFNNSLYFVEVADDVTIEDVLRPVFWAHHTRRIEKNNRVSVVRADGAFDVDLRAIEVGVGFIKMRVLRLWEDEAAVKERAERAQAEATGDGVEALPTEYKITASGRGFNVTFMPTDAKIATGIKTRGEAVNAAKTHAKNAGIAWPDAAPATPTPGD